MKNQRDHLRAQTGRTKVFSSLSSFPSVKCLLMFLLIVLANTPVEAQIQEAWVAHYNNGVTNGNHQALKLALDSTGNVYVCGFSQNTDSGTGYATIKYAPNGSQLWAARFDSTNVPQASPTSFAVDVSNDIVVTGNAGTVRWDANGNPLWSNSYAGLAITTDTNANVLITGFGTNFNSAKINPNGTNLWLRTYQDVGPTVGRQIIADSNGNAYVSGLDVYNWQEYHTWQCLLVRAYGPGGSLVWQFQDTLGGTDFDIVVRVASAAIDLAGESYVLFEGSLSGPHVDKVNINGNEIWQASGFAPEIAFTSFGLANGIQGNIAVTGRYGTYGISSNGIGIWENDYPFQAAIATDNANNFYVTGYSPDANGTNDIVTIAYDTHGKQLWLQRYSGAANAGAVGNAIARASYGWVAGFVFFHVSGANWHFNWYVFNLADVAIVAGVIGLLYESLAGERAQKAP